MLYWTSNMNIKQCIQSFGQEISGKLVTTDALTNKKLK